MILESSFKKPGCRGSVRGKGRWKAMSEARMERDGGILFCVSFPQGWTTGTLL